jgi:hypothetical protein
MKLTKKYLRKLIKEAIVETEESKELDLRLTRDQANVLLLALEDYREAESPEAIELYNIILDAGTESDYGREEEEGRERDEIDDIADQFGLDADDPSRLMGYDSSY